MPKPKNKPLNPRLYARIKAEADRLFLSPTSAYKSGWIVKTYKERGGTYETLAPAADAPSAQTGQLKNTGLKRWFKEKWVDLNRPNGDGTYAECGRDVASRRGTFPLCRPSRHINRGSPRTPDEIPREAVEKAKKAKQRVKDKGRIRFVV